MNKGILLVVDAVSNEGCPHEKIFQSSGDCAGDCDQEKIQKARLKCVSRSIIDR